MSYSADPPSNPRNLAVTETGDCRISVKWDEPDTDGGSPVTGYIVETKPVGSTKYTRAGKVKATEKSYDITG